MARVIWTGSLAFGLVNVPVGLYAATEDKTVHFNQFEAGTTDRIRYKRVNERTGKEVDYAGIVKGHEVGKGNFVLISDEELEAVEPGRSRTIEISDFVDLHDIDPIYFRKTYYLAPRGEGAEHAYTLLREAMARTGKAAVATFVMRGKQYLVSIRAGDDVLVLETMYFADEIRDPRTEIGELPSKRAPKGRELAVATQLIESMASEWKPENYRDTYRDQVEDLIERKANGEEIVAEGEPAEQADVVDLMDALRRSAEAARERRSGREPAKSGKSQERADGGAAEAGGGIDEGDLSEMTKDQLSELAARMDVEGRSKMTRDELEAAVRRAQRGSRRKAAS
jgi:DNA end-binding protein Ku